MLRTYLCLSLLLAAALLPAQNENIYNDDPMQKLPLGMEESEYEIREPSGEHFTEGRIEPPFWWTGMNNPELEILIYGRNIGDAGVSIDYPGVELLQVTRVENPNYLFVKVSIGPGTPAGQMDIVVRNEVGVRSYGYELRERQPQDSRILGLGPEDLIYLIMPDRFANGDPDNDTVEGMTQTGTNRAKVFFRHGGDLVGIMERLDYLAGLGVTAIWLNPVLENDQPYESYHGYAITDHYNIDARFGTNEQYKQLVERAHARGIKVVMDVIFNHTGDEHWFIKDLPGEDWIHQWPEFTRTTYRATTLMDPHASDYDRKLMTEGWFDKHMPDLNQDNEQLANYLIQNSIWWTEYSGHDAFRIDTYAYPDPGFMDQWNRRMLQEYPQLGIFGETWVHGPAVQAYFTEGRRLNPDQNTKLPGVTDFQLYYAINEALGREPGWTEGVLRLYYTLAQDFLYDDPYRNVLFLDNHDLARFYTSVGQDMTKFKSGLALLMTLRGIPMLYYGTEVLLGGEGGGFGEGGRVEFPGGWRGDEVDKFRRKGRTDLEQASFEYVQRLANYRKNTPALQTGKLTQFVPKDGMYVYFRHNNEQSVMVVFNATDKPQTFTTAPYRNQIGAYEGGYDVTRDERVDRLEGMELQAKEVRVVELR